VKLNITSVEVHPQLSNNGHPVDDVLVGAGSLLPKHKYLNPVFKIQYLQTSWKFNMKVPVRTFFALILFEKWLLCC
jgi:hypothetical protein